MGRKQAPLIPEKTLEAFADLLQMEIGYTPGRYRGQRAVKLGLGAMEFRLDIVEGLMLEGNAGLLLKGPGSFALLLSRHGRTLAFTVHVIDWSRVGEVPMRGFFAALNPTENSWVEDAELALAPGIRAKLRANSAKGPWTDDRSLEHGTGT